MKTKNNNNLNKLFAIAAIFLLSISLVTGCTAKEEASPTTTKQAAVEEKKVEQKQETCTEKECFVQQANDCKKIEITLTEEAGAFKYAASNECKFTKTLVSLNENETTEMKNLLEGKSFTCNYDKGKFDQRWAYTLIFGTEECNGELKDTLIDLLVFAE